MIHEHETTHWKNMKTPQMLAQSSNQDHSLHLIWKPRSWPPPKGLELELPQKIGHRKNRVPFWPGYHWNRWRWIHRKAIKVVSSVLGVPRIIQVMDDNFSIETYGDLGYLHDLGNLHMFLRQNRHHQDGQSTAAVSCSVKVTERSDPVGKNAW